MELNRSMRVWVLGLAAAATLSGACAREAWGQYPVENGRANDASNRIGSGGFNGGGVPAPETLGGGNAIVTGNVTGAKAFRGNAGYRAAGEFSGNSATYNYEQRLRDFSAPQVSYNAQQPNYSNAPQQFYTSVSKPPAGYVATPAPGVGGFVPGTVQPLQSTRFDDRLGVMTNVGDDGYMPKPGQLILPGPVDASAQPTYIAATPLTGVRQFSGGDPGLAGLYAGSTGFGGRRLNDEQILRMRRELSNTLATPDLPEPTLPGNGGATAVPGQPQPLGGTPDGTSSGGPQQIGGATGPKPLDSGALAANANNFATGASQDRVLATPAQQSSQYAEMQRRLQQRSGGGSQRAMTDEERNRVFQQEQRALKQQREKAEAGGTVATPGQAPQPQLKKDDRPLAADLGAAGKKEENKKEGDDRTVVQSPTGGVTAVVPTNPNAEPVDVRSLSTGVRAKGLRSLLEQAETNMQEGKYDTAIGVYESAMQVAPNNPMILLGQANAELGGEYFARADNHLRQAFLLDPALLMARYDLRGMIGDKRVDQVVESLKKIAATETRESRAAFLLAYVAYNTRDAERAASYLELAEKRSPSPDPVFRILRSHWNLPAAAAPDGNK